MEQILNLTQHVATPEQVAAGVVDLPQEQREKLIELLTFEELPTSGEIRERVKAIIDIVSEVLPPHSKVMVGGAPFLMGILQNQLLEGGFTPLFAFSKRVSVEEMIDGCVKKVSVFKHEGFVEVI
jgi:hypothetical protein